MSKDNVISLNDHLHRRRAKQYEDDDSDISWAPTREQLVQFVEWMADHAGGFDADEFIELLETPEYFVENYLTYSDGSPIYPDEFDL